MNRELRRRMERAEANQPAKRSPEIMKWLGYPVDLALTAPESPMTPTEEAGLLASLPSHLREWFGDRLFPLTAN